MFIGPPFYYKNIYKEFEETALKRKFIFLFLLLPWPVIAYEKVIIVKG